MGNKGNEAQNKKSEFIMENPSSSVQNLVPKPPLAPAKWKPNTYRKRNRVVVNKPIPPKDKDVEGPAIGTRQSSWLWDHFTRFEEDEQPRAACNYCGKDYAAHSKCHGTGEHVKKALIRLYDYYKQCDSSHNGKHVPSSPNQASFDDTIDENVDTAKFLSSQFARHSEENECIDRKSELTRYLEENCEKDIESFDVLQWWKVNSSKYPILSQIAREVLAIPVSTVASKSAFSTSGRILDPYRSSLNPEMVEALVCCQNWLRSKPITINFQESMKEIPIGEVQKYEQIIKEFQTCSTSVEAEVIKV